MGREVTIAWVEEWKTHLEDKRRRELLLGVEGAFLDLAEGFLALTAAFGVDSVRPFPPVKIARGSHAPKEEGEKGKV